MTQWAFVTLGKTDAAKQITVIPESKNKQVNKEAKKRMTRLMTAEEAHKLVDPMLMTNPHAAGPVVDAFKKEKKLI